MQSFSNEQPLSVAGFWIALDQIITSIRAYCKRRNISERKSTAPFRTEVIAFKVLNMEHTIQIALNKINFDTNCSVIKPSLVALGFRLPIEVMVLKPFAFSLKIW